MSVLVFGSINMDLVAKTSHLPKSGETLQANQFLTLPGGKGANQSVATAKLGINTYLVGRVGGDRFAPDLLESLQSSGVNIEQVKIDNSVSSGLAMIVVDEQGENQIIVISGANGQVDETDVERANPLLSQVTTLLLQLEVPLATVRAIAQSAQQQGVRVILDPAPVSQPLPKELYPHIDMITPNETEAEKLVGFPLTDEATYQQAAQWFFNQGVKIVVLTLGSKGCFCATQQEQFYFPSFQVNAIDTVAAGDGFNGGMAAALDQGLSLKEAIRWGTAAGALATTKQGAQSSLCDHHTLETFLLQQNRSLKATIPYLRKRNQD